MVWDYPINDSLWINALTMLLIGSMWVAFLSVVAIASIATGRALRWLADQIVAWDARHAIQ